MVVLFPSIFTTGIFIDVQDFPHSKVVGIAPMSLASQLDAILQAVNNGRVLWKKHALQRMMERNISRQSVKQVLLEGIILEEYPDDFPVPSALMALITSSPLHVVLAWNTETAECYIITAYTPDSNHFEDDLITRRLI